MVDRDEFKRVCIKLEAVSLDDYGDVVHWLTQPPHKRCIARPQALPLASALCPRATHQKAAHQSEPHHWRS